MGYFELKWSEVPITGWIYFIEYHEFGPVKIGYATNIDKRLIGLQTACPYELKVLLGIPGGYECETALHMHFYDERMHGEWFSQTRKIKRLIRKLSQFERVYPEFLPFARDTIKNQTKKRIIDAFNNITFDCIIKSNTPISFEQKQEDI